MTAIERTAYPQFKTQPSTKELAELYSPTAQEVAFAQAQTKSKRGLLRLLVMLKSFQRLGYFPRSEAVPVAVVNHIRTCLNLSAKVSAIAPERSRYVYQNIIRSYLGVHSYDQKAQKAMATAVAHAAEVMDHPADLINVAIEELVKERYELPAFSTLDRLVRRIRTATNTRLFHRLSEAMTAKEQQFVDQLLAPSAPDPTQPAEFEVTLALLKAPPKSARLSHIEALQAKFNRIMSFGDANRLVATIAPAKVKAFAAQAKALTLCDLQDAKVPKRRALLVCLLYQAQVKTRDHLVEMFLKRMHKIHKSDRERLSALREKHLAQTESILDLFTEVLQVSITEADDATVGSGVRSLLQLHGGGSTLLEQCQEIKAYNSDNYLPLVWRFYSRYRTVLLRLVQSLDLQSTGQDQSLIEALTFVLSQAHRRSKWLAAELDLSFISDRWRRLVVEQHNGKSRLVRQQLEVCIFTYLAAELKSGDACVVGSENFADFRNQLLDWQPCQSQLEAYCEQLGLASAAEPFVEHLQSWLTQVAQTVDQICKDGTQLTINEAGEPVLKRLTASQPPEGAQALEAAILQRLPERSVLDVLCNVEHWLHWVRHFGPVSGSEPKLDHPTERYILTVFGYGCNLGPNQTARHTRG